MNPLQCVFNAPLVLFPVKYQLCDKMHEVTASLNWIHVFFFS